MLLKRSLFLVAVRKAVAPAIVPVLCASGLLAALTSGVSAGAQASTSQSSSSSKLPPPPTIDANVNRNLTLNDVRYDNKYDIYGGVGSAHFNAGPSLLSGGTWAASTSRALDG